MLERLAHLEGKLKEMEEENKSQALSLRIADLSHRLWKPPEILVYTLLKETIKKKRGFTPVCRLLVFFLALTKYLKKKAIRLCQWRGETETGEEFSPHGQKPWKTFPVKEQFFAVLPRLHLGLKAKEVYDRNGLAPSTFSRTFATWVVFFFCIGAAFFVSNAM